MKLRYVLAIFTVLLLTLFHLNFRQIQKSGDSTIDVVRINENYKKVIAGIENGEKKQTLEDRYKCQIVLKTDADYASCVMSALKNGKILVDYESENKLLGKIIFSGERDMLESLRHTLIYKMAGVYICILFAGYLLMGVIYYFYVRPFMRLQCFAADIAKGNLDVPLPITKNNYFGIFTESFDVMREELKTARENEYRANVSKKELVAGLSHDMKTPIATVKAACEVLKVKAYRDDSVEERKDILEKVEVIEQRADMLDQLIGNMFHATLEELENLKVEPEERPSTCIIDMLQELQHYSTIRIQPRMPECLVYIDTLRFKQVMDNIVNNSYKYAGTEIDIFFKEEEKGIVLEIRDYGEGVSGEELPLLTEKFYRGKNGKEKSGAGLGLFLAKYFMENMDGALECFCDNGFVVNLFLHKV